MNRWLTLGVSIWVVSWIGERYEDRPCTDQEITEQKLERCEDKIGEPMQKRFDDKDEADLFVKDFLDDADASVVQEEAVE